MALRELFLRYTTRPPDLLLIRKINSLFKLRIKVHINRERTVKILQQVMLCILLTQQCLLHGDTPVDTKTFVNNAHTTIISWGIKVVTLILENSSLAQYSKTMCETTRHEELTMIILCQFYSHMLTVCRRTLTNVKCNIENSSLNTTNQFRLRIRHCLKMQSTHHAIA